MSRLSKVVLLPLVAVFVTIACLPNLRRRLLPMRDAGTVLIDKKLRSLSSPGKPALNCGLVGIRENPTIASDCALNAFAHRSPFYVRYNLLGIDSEVSAGLAGDAQGNVHFVEYDSMGWETDGLAKGAEITDGKHIYTEPCPNPVALRKTRSGRLTCARGNPNASRNIMSPTLDPY